MNFGYKMSKKSTKVSKLPKLLYLIGPGYMVKGHSLNTLSFLESHYDLVIASGFGHNESNQFFIHTLKSFRRTPSIIKDIKLLYELAILFKRTKPNVVVYSTPKISFFALIVNFVYRIPAVYIHRGAIYQNYQGIKRKIYKAIDWLTINGSDETFFISKSLHAFVTNDLSLEKIQYNRRYNSAQGLHSDYYSSNLDETVKYKVLSKTLKVGYLGRFAKDKGFFDVVDIAKSFNEKKDVQFYFKGMPDPGFKYDEADLLALNIKFLPWDDQVIEFLTEIDVLLFPSRREGFGNVCIQAGACGIPTIGIDGPGVRDAIMEPVTGYLASNSDNFVTLATDVIERMRKKELNWNYENCRRFILKKFNRDKIARELGVFIKRAMCAREN